MLRSVDVDGVHWSYREEGQGEVVVLLHGLASEAGTWDSLVPELARTHRTIAIDLPGYSVLSSGAKVEEPQRMAAATARFLTELGVGTCTIIGHSFGGTLALLLAREEPARCTGLVLIAPGGFGTELNPLVTLLGTRAGSTLLRAAYSRTASRAVRGLASRYSSRSLSRNGAARAGSEVRIAEVMQTYERLASASARTQLRDGVRHARRSKRADAIAGSVSLSLDIPILILWGSEDLVLPPWQAQQAQLALPWSQVTLISGAGHTPHRSHASETTAAVLGFLGSAPVTARIAALRA